MTLLDAAVQLWCTRHARSDYDERYERLRARVDRALLAEMRAWDLLFYVDLFAEGIRLSYVAQWHRRTQNTLLRVRDSAQMQRVARQAVTPHDDDRFRFAALCVVLRN